MSLREILANNFKALKASRLGLSKLPEITKAGGGSNGTLGRIQKGETGVSIDALDPLAAAYGVEPWQLLACFIPNFHDVTRIAAGIKQWSAISFNQTQHKPLPG